MRLRTQLSLAFLLLAVVPLFGMTLYSYWASQQAFRRAVEAEAGALAADMTSRLEAVAAELSVRIQRMRERSREHPSRPFEKARLEALAAAEQAELRLSLRAAVAGTPRERRTIPFALDADGRLCAPDDDSLARLQGLGLVTPTAGSTSPPVTVGDWVVVKRPDRDHAITVGVARPVGEALREIRDTAVRNLSYGLGMLPHGAEFARLAGTFNRMVRELRRQQERALEQERLRKELEIGRRIQEELLPRRPLCMPFAEVSGVSIPARDVGGDFFNYFSLPAGEPFGMERLEALLRVHRAGDLPGLFARVDEAVRGHRGRLEPADDATILGLRVAGPGIGGQTA